MSQQILLGIIVSTELSHITALILSHSVHWKIIIYDGLLMKNIIIAVQNDDERVRRCIMYMDRVMFNEQLSLYLYGLHLESMRYGANTRELTLLEHTDDGWDN